jgi:dihydrodipicolinate synthase/N-acetylneuraminate lyase
MKKHQTKRLSVVIITNTPFTKDGQLDEPAYRRQLRRLNLPEASVFVAGSATGEVNALSPEERLRVMAIAAEELKGKVPVRAMGAEPRTANEMIDYLQAVKASGLEAAGVFSLDMGHGAKPTPAEMEHYYRSVLESTDIDIYLSSHRTVGYFLPLDLIESLVNRYPHIAGIAYGGPDIPYLADLIRRVGDRIEVHCAGPGNALSSLGLGGNGFMGGEGNISPEMVTSVISAFAAGDREALRKNFARLMAFATIYVRFGGATMRGMKPLMNAFGLPGGELRPPRLPISDADLRQMIAEVEKLKLPGLPAHAKFGV